MKKIILLSTLFVSLLAHSQSNFQRKLFQSGGTGTVTEVVYSSEYNTTTLIIENLAGPAAYTGFATLTKFTTTTGNVTSSKSFSIAGYDLAIKSVVKNNQMLYMVASLTNSTAVTGCIIKYNLSTNATVWRRTLSTGTITASLNAITFDKDKNLYLSGIYNSVNLLVSKVDTNGNLGWIKSIPQNSYTPIPSNILYNSKRELYVTCTGTINTTSIAAILRMDSSGAILNTNSLYTSQLNGFREKYSAILKGKLTTLDKTVNLSTSDAGPCLVRTLDTNLVAINTKTLDGLNVKQVFANNVNFLITGAAPVNLGLYGFRTIRLDTVLTIFGSRYYKKLYNSGNNTSASCFINSTNNSYHFFKSDVNDTVLYARADSYEGVGCGDTAYVPVITTALSHSLIAYTYTTIPVSGTLTTITLPIGTVTYSSTSLCSSLTTGISPVSDNAFISLYPNPANSVLRINAEADLISKFIIRDITGKEMLEGDFETSINVAHLSKGLYFVSLYDGSKKLLGIKKFIKE